jgi:hypothetical protein
MTARRDDERPAPPAGEGGAREPEAGWVEHDAAAILRDFSPGNAPAAPRTGPALDLPDWLAEGAPDGPAPAPPPAAKAPAAEPEGWWDVEPPKPAAPAAPAAPPPAREPPPAASGPGPGWDAGGPRAVHVPRGQPARSELGADPRRIVQENRDRQAWRAAAVESERRRRQRQSLYSALGVGAVIIAGTAALWFWRHRDDATASAGPAAPVAAPPSAAPLPKERPPAVVRTGTRFTETAVQYTRLVVTGGPAKFTGVESNTVLCESADACSVPVDEPVRIEAKGHKPRTIPSADLKSHIDGEQAIQLD